MAVMKIDDKVLKELEALKKEHELASVSAVVRRLLKQTKYTLKG